MPLALFALLVAATLAVSLVRNGGHFVYPLDDTYIHMAMARSIALDHVWGVTPYQFTSSSSSPFYTGLLALCYVVFGVRETVPLLLGIVFAALTVLVVYRILRDRGHGAVTTGIVAVAIILLTPLVALAFTGMEHPLHLLLTMVFAYASARLLAGEPVSNRMIGAMAALAAVLPMVRYEGLFTVAVVCLLLLLRRRIVLAFGFGALAIVPVALFGVWSVHNGWYPVPNSVLLKGSAPELGSLSGIARTLLTGYNQAIAAPHLAALALVALVTLFLHFRRGGTFWSVPAMMLTIFLAGLVLHLQFAKTGWVYRYEAYLMALGLLAIAIGTPANSLRLRRLDNAGQRGSAMLVMLFLAAPLLIRAAAALFIIPAATTNIYQQQYQMAAFLRQYYGGRTVAANDIGAITYFADIRCLDLFGLADMDVARAKRAGRFDTRRIAAIAARDGVDIAIVYDRWYDPYGGLPRQWVKVGEWTTPDNHILGGDTVSFYAVKPGERERLLTAFRTFAARLPAGMTWRESA